MSRGREEAGLRGQPAMAFAVEFTDTTLTLTAFGRQVWSCVLRGGIDPDASTFHVEDGIGMLPVVYVTVRKASASATRWGGLIESVGEDSLLQ